MGLLSFSIEMVGFDVLMLGGVWAFLFGIDMDVCLFFLFGFFFFDCFFLVGVIIFFFCFSFWSFVACFDGVFVFLSCLWFCMFSR